MGKSAFPVLLALTVVLCASSASARMWKPTPLQLAQDYSFIDHNKGNDGRTQLRWLAAPDFTTPTAQDALNKYLLLNIVHTHPEVGTTVWDDVVGVTASDGDGNPLKDVAETDWPVFFVSLVAGFRAVERQASQGKAKSVWLLLEPGAVNACAKGKLNIAYGGETYTYDTPLPGCTAAK